MEQKPYLQEKSLTGSGDIFIVEDRLIIGRSIDCTISLNYASISRHHAEIFEKESEFFIRDLNSRNGTFLNGEKVSTARIKDKDIIDIKPRGFIFRNPLASETQIGYQDQDPASREAFTKMTTLHSVPLPEEISQSQENNSEKNFHLLITAIQAFSSKKDLDDIFSNVIEEVLKIIPAHNAAIFQKDERGILILKAHKKKQDPRGDFSYSKSIIRKVAIEKQAFLVLDTSQSDSLKAEESIVDYDIKSVMCSPLLFQDNLMGIIYLDSHGVIQQFNENSLQLLTGLSSAAASAINNSLVVEKIKNQAEKLEKSNYQMMFTLANTIEARDHYTAGHTWRVTRLSEIIANMLGWSEKKLVALRTGGVLHDIGKIGIPDTIIQKPGKLTKEEFEIMKTHPKRGSLILKEAKCLPEAIPYILHHHERYDGKGYPYELKGEAIPIEGRVLAVADAFDTMTSDRPYRKGMPADKAMAIIRENAGTQFDPKIVELFSEAYEKGHIHETIQKYEISPKSVECPFCSTAISTPKEMAPNITMVCPICEHKYRIDMTDSGTHAVRTE